MGQDRVKEGQETLEKEEKTRRQGLWVKKSKKRDGWVRDGEWRRRWGTSRKSRRQDDCWIWLGTVCVEWTWRRCGGRRETQDDLEGGEGSGDRKVGGEGQETRLE